MLNEDFLDRFRSVRRDLHGRVVARTGRWWRGVTEGASVAERKRRERQAAKAEAKFRAQQAARLEQHCRKYRVWFPGDPL